jgi:ribosomal protein L40E
VDGMDEKSMKVTVKILLLCGILFCGISQLVPWVQLSFEGFGSVDYYSWGVGFSSSLGQGGTSFYFSENAFTTLLGTTGNLVTGIISILLYFILPLSIIALIAGAYSVFNIEKKRTKSPVSAGILCIIAPVILYITIQSMTLSLGGSLGMVPYQISFGFILMIVASGFFFSGYFLSKKIQYAPTMQQIPPYQVPSPTPGTPYPTSPPNVTPAPPPSAGASPQPISATQPPQSITPGESTTTPNTTSDNQVYYNTVSQQIDKKLKNIKFCPECGAKVDSDAKFCEECGAKIE